MRMPKHNGFRRRASQQSMMGHLGARYGINDSSIALRLAGGNGITQRDAGARRLVLRTEWRDDCTNDGGGEAQWN
jgi:hypothetical protein